MAIPDPEITAALAADHKRGRSAQVENRSIYERQPDSRVIAMAKQLFLADGWIEEDDKYSLVMEGSISSDLSAACHQIVASVVISRFNQPVFNFISPLREYNFNTGFFNKLSIPALYFHEIRSQIRQEQQGHEKGGRAL